MSCRTPCHRSVEHGNPPFNRESLRSLPAWRTRQPGRSGWQIRRTQNGARTVSVAHCPCACQNHSIGFKNNGRTPDGAITWRPMYHGRLTTANGSQSPTFQTVPNSILAASCRTESGRSGLLGTTAPFDYLVANSALVLAGYDLFLLPRDEPPDRSTW